MSRRTDQEPWRELEPRESIHRIVFSRGWAPDADGIWPLAKRARSNLDAGRTLGVRRGWVRFLGTEKPQQGEALRPARFPLLARCRQRTESLVDPKALGLVEGVDIHGPLPRR
jgi:hypothetical protein